MQSVKEQKALIKQYGGPAKDEVTELENLLNEQTTALEAQTIRSAELEGSLSQVLQEYSKRVNSSNEEINSLHTQLSKQNGLHQQQLREIRLMYETKINEMKVWCTHSFPFSPINVINPHTHEGNLAGAVQRRSA